MWCLSTAGLSLSEANINFLACSNMYSVFALEMADALVDELLKLEEGIVVFDYVSQRDVLVLSPVYVIMPMGLNC